MTSSPLAKFVYDVIRSRLPPRQSLNSSVSADSVCDLCSAVANHLSAEPVMLRVLANIHIVGDIHGNIDDLLRIFERCGYPPETRYLFLGDYVDRGNCGVEVLVLLFALKCMFPTHVYLLRGNHETDTVGGSTDFLKECRQKYSQAVFRKCHETFQLLPIAAIVGDGIFCVHGGISPLLKSVEEFEKMDKPGAALSPLFIDLLWSDPSSSVNDFSPSGRGASLFGEAPLRLFLERNRLSLLIRAHEMCSDGVCFPFATSNQCVTVFSTSDYCGDGNAAAVVTVSHDLMVDSVVFPKLSAKAKQMRRVQFPEWLLRESPLGDPETDSPAVALQFNHPAEIPC
jgi:protein phosphatase